MLVAYQRGLASAAERGSPGPTRGRSRRLAGRSWQREAQRLRDGVAEFRERWPVIGLRAALSGGMGRQELLERLEESKIA